MRRLSTADGFEFETTYEGTKLHCVCRREGVEAAFTCDTGTDDEAEAMKMLEMVEMIARCACLTGIPRDQHPPDC